MQTFQRKRNCRPKHYGPVLTKKKLIRIVAELWNVGYENPKVKRTVEAIFESMRAALQRDERIQIWGLGTFYARQYPPKRHFYSVFKGRRKIRREYFDRPAMKKAVFVPWAGLRKAANADYIKHHQQDS